jgi:DNA polymerase-3 subunit gamma/tau
MLQTPPGPEGSNGSDRFGCRSQAGASCLQFLMEISMHDRALARKWRPRDFKEMVGQEHVLRMLMNALSSQRLHHAYLFTGTRGVGKTTLARILAKCLNCEKGITAEPCNTCSTCVSIDSGRFLDLIEIDAASRTKVEDTREILDNVQYAPSQGRYKIYLIDEVHMLSGHSFNALLKTLEEPPSHVKFLLATTDPKKLPITILSRCLQFNLKRVPIEQIAKQLEHICTTEKIDFEKDALQQIAKAADGSLRDALSLLDQAIAFCGEKISVKETRQMLGSIEQEALYRLLQALVENDGKKLLSEIASFAESAPDFSQALEDILTILHQMSVAQLVPDFSLDENSKKLAAHFSAEEIQLYYQIALIGRRDLQLAPHPAQGFEMVILRMLAFQPVSERTVRPEETAARPSTVRPEERHKVPRLEGGERPIEKEIPSDWSALLEKLALTGMAQALATNCSLVSKTDDKIELALAKTHEVMYNKKLVDRIEQALTQYLKKPMKLEIKITAANIQTPAKEQKAHQEKRQAGATETIQNDSYVKDILDTFDATLDVNSIKAIE